LAVAVHDPLQSALHLVVQLAVVGTLTHWVVHLSLQHAPHEAVHSAIDEADDVVVVVLDASGDPAATVASASRPPSSVAPESDSSVPPDEVVVVVDDEEHEALHPDSHRSLQSVVQSNIAGLVEHELVHIELQLDVQSEAADSVHCESQDCSSCAAHALMHTVGAHWVEQLLLVTSWQVAFASMSTLPHSLTTVARASCANAVSAAKGIEANAPWAQWFVEGFMGEPNCNRRATSRDRRTNRNGVA
jgi:hypothetical protein